jgi:hypothetical protein
MNRYLPFLLLVASCPIGYNIVDRTSGLVAIPMDGGTMAASDYRLAIECK